MMKLLPLKFSGAWLIGAVFGMTLTTSAWADEALKEDLTAPPAMSSTPTSASVKPSADNNKDVFVLSPYSDLMQAAPAKGERARSTAKTAKSEKTDPNGATESASKSTKAKKTTSASDSEVSVLGGLYVYVDEMGVPHYSLQPLDERYTSFANAGPIMDGDIKLAVGLPDGKLSNLSAYSYAGGAAASSTVQRRLLSSANLARFEATIRKHATEHGVDVNLVKAVMAAESGFNSAAISPKNAMGLMQVIPPTAARYGVSADQLMNPERNIYAGVRYLRDLSRMFQGRPDLIIAAYNAGEGAVYKYNRRIPPYAETQNYVRKVMQYYQVYNGSSIAFASEGIDVKVRGSASAKKGRVVMTATQVGVGSRRAMQRVGNVAVNAPVVISN